MKISKEEFKKMRKAYKDKNPDTTQGVKFEKESIDELLNSPGVAGVRVYFGENDEGKNTVMLVGTDTNGADLLDGVIIDYGQLCPPFC